MSNSAENAILLHTEGLCKSYPDGQVQALKGAAVIIRRGDYLAITGPSGSGKSTLLNLLGGLDRPTNGEVFFEGRPLSAWGRLDHYRAKKVGFVFQSFLLLPTLTAAENVQIPMFEGALSPSARRLKANDLLGTVGLCHRANHLPNQMSVGERQRVAIARALANDPPLLLADEPTGSLDSETASGVLDLFDQLHRNRRLTLVVVTHNEQLARRASRTLRLLDGRLFSEGEPDALASKRFQTGGREH
jgi:putative ABC transport system ATP-binding protein